MEIVFVCRLGDLLKLLKQTFQQPLDIGENDFIPHG